MLIIAPVDKEFSGAQMHFLRVLRYTLLMHYKELKDDVELLIMPLDEAINPYTAIELQELYRVMSCFPRPFKIRYLHLPASFKTLRSWVLNNIFLGLTDSLKCNDKVFIGAGDLMDFLLFSFIKRKYGIKTGILLGNILTGIIPQVAIRNLNLAVKYAGKLGVRKKLDTDFKSLLIVFTKYVETYDIIVTPGLSITKILIKEGFKNRIIPFKNPTIPLSFKPPVKSTKEVFTLGFVSRYFPGKGLRQFIEIVNEIKSKEKIKLIIVGVNPSQVKNLKHGFNDISIHESINPLTLPNVIQKLDMLLYPSLIDSWAHIIPEALALGVPVMVPKEEPFTTNYPDCKALIKFPLQKISHASEIIENIINDPSFLRELKQTAYEYALKNFNPRTVTENFIRILRSI
jgi:glycosyltransferase involved in cell wall biosynthesis